MFIGTVFLWDIILQKFVHIPMYFQEFEKGRCDALFNL